MSGIITYKEKGGKGYSRIPHGLERCNLTGNGFSLYFYLLKNINKENLVEVSYNEIANHLNITRKTAMNSLEVLIENGLIKRIKRTGDDGSCLSNAYEIYKPSALGG